MTNKIKESNISDGAVTSNKIAKVQLQLID